jgi:branched-chain amino acid transport system substrate-binding protein
MISDSKVLGMVGPFNSNVAKAEIPIANSAHLTMISPANTNECLTKDLPYCAGLAKQLRPTGVNNYFRVAATDDLQGPAMADYAYDTLNLKMVAVGSDNETYGKGIADTFSKEFQSKGGQVVKRQDFDIPSTNDFKPFLSSAKGAGAQGIYFGGTDSNKACVVRAQMKGIFDPSVPEMGGDGLQTAQCLKDAGDNGTGIYATVAAANADAIPSAKSTIQSFKSAFPNKTDYGAYTMPAFDAAGILIQGISNAIDSNNGNMPSREQVRAAVAKTSGYQGVLGTTSFDQNGDTSAKIISIYEAKGSPIDWAFIKQVNQSSSSTS